MAAKYYDALYGRNQRLVLWGVVVDGGKVTAELGAMGEFLPKAIALYSHHEDHNTIPIATIGLNELSGIADSGLMTDVTFSRCSP